MQSESEIVSAQITCINHAHICLQSFVLRLVGIGILFIWLRFLWALHHYCINSLQAWSIPCHQKPLISIPSWGYYFIIKVMILKTLMAVGFVGAKVFTITWNTRGRWKHSFLDFLHTLVPHGKHAYLFWSMFWMYYARL